MLIALLLIFFLISETVNAQYNLWHGMVSGGGCKQVRNSCQDHYNAGCKTTGQFKVKINSVITTVRCEQEIAGGGWMVFQMREALFDFYRDWASYKAGFTYNDQNFWLGLDKLSQATLTAKRMAVYLEKGTGTKAIAYYSSFKVNDESDNYRIASLGTYSYETASPYAVPGDSMAITLNQKFTTRDRDNDTLTYGNCAHYYLGGWWYQQCHSANLNGYYFWSPSNPTGAHASYADGINWYHFYPEINQSNNGHYYSLKKVFMMIK